MTTTRIIDPGATANAEDPALRPRNLDEYIGQASVVENLKVYIRAAKARGEAKDHVLLAGPPGLGKTSLAQIVASMLDVPFVMTAGPALERKGDIAAYLTVPKDLREGARFLVFPDFKLEHRLPIVLMREPAPSR